MGFSLKYQFFGNPFNNDCDCTTCTTREKLWKMAVENKQAKELDDIDAQYAYYQEIGDERKRMLCETSYERIFKALKNQLRQYEQNRSAGRPDLKKGSNATLAELKKMEDQKMGSLASFDTDMINYTITALDADGNVVGKPYELQNTMEDLVNGVSITTTDGPPLVVKTVTGNNTNPTYTPYAGFVEFGQLSNMPNNLQIKSLAFPPTKQPTLEDLLEMVKTMKAVGMAPFTSDTNDKAALQALLAGKKQMPAAIIEREPSISEEMPRRKIRSL